MAPEENLSTMSPNQAMAMGRAIVEIEKGKKTKTIKLKDWNWPVFFFEAFGLIGKGLFIKALISVLLWLTIIGGFMYWIYSSMKANEWEIRDKLKEGWQPKTEVDSIVLKSRGYII